MALQKQYDSTPLQVLTSAEMRERIRVVAKKAGISQAQLMRDMIEYALPRQEELYGVGDE